MLMPQQLQNGAPQGNTASAVLRIDGLTLDEWRERMSQLNLQDPASAAAVPGLIAVMQSGEVPWFTRRQAALTLGRMGPLAASAVGPLIELLDETGPDADTAPQLWAIRALGLFGPAAGDATPHLVAILNDDRAPLLVRLSAVETLSQIGSRHPQAIAALIDRVQATPDTRDNHELRRAAIEALGFVGPAANSAMPLLLRALDDPNENVRLAAAATLGRWGPLSAAAAEHLLQRLYADDSPAVREAAAVAIGSIGPDFTGHLLAGLLTVDDPVVRGRAATIFGGWGSAARPWSAAVRSLWDDPDAAVRLAALEASWRIESRGDRLAPRIAALVGDDDRQIRRQAVTLLSRMQHHAAAARPTIELMLHDERPDVRTAAQKAIEAIETVAADDVR